MPFYRQPVIEGLKGQVRASSAHGRLTAIILSAMPLVTPPFPEYTSGHSVQSAAAATVLTAQFGVTSFTDRTHESRGLPARSFNSFEAAAAEAWDIAFLGSDPARETLIDFTAAYLEIDATYLVPSGSPLRAVADVDRPGVRVAAPSGATLERRAAMKALGRSTATSSSSTGAPTISSGPGSA